MRLAIVQGCQGVSIPLLVIAYSFCSQLLDGNKYSDAISNLLDSHLFEHELITLDKVVPGNIVD